MVSRRSLNQSTEERNMSMGMSDALEASIKEYSIYLLTLHECKTADELEFNEAEIHNTLSQQFRDIRKNEQPTMQLLEFLAEAHGKSAIVALGYDPFSMTPIVRLDGDEIAF
jgi:hypothetical protein